MNQIFLMAADYLKGKPIYAPLRRALNFLFIVSVASFIFQKFYGPYYWYDITDYKAILNFFINGHFFIPLSIYAIVHGLSLFISSSIFALWVHSTSMRQTREIIAYEVKKEQIDAKIASLNAGSLLPVKITPALMRDLVNELRSYLSSKAYADLERKLQKPKDAAQAYFQLFFRAFIAITFYFISIPKFGWLLYLLVCISLWVAMRLAIWTYRFAEITPTLIAKFKLEAERYVLNYETSPEIVETN